jgi:hypothetical protein
MIRSIGRRKDYGAIEQRFDPLPAGRHVALPKLQLAPPLGAPTLIEVEQQVEAAVQSQPAMPVEVGMNLEIAAAGDLMETAAFKAGIGDESRNPREPFEECKKVGGVQALNKALGSFARSEALCFLNDA